MIILLETRTTLGLPTELAMVIPATKTTDIGTEMIDIRTIRMIIARIATEAVMTEARTDLTGEAMIMEVATGTSPPMTLSTLDVAIMATERGRGAVHHLEITATLILVADKATPKAGDP